MQRWRYRECQRPCADGDAVLALKRVWVNLKGQRESHQAHSAKLCFGRRKDETCWNVHKITAALLRKYPLFLFVVNWAIAQAVYVPDARIAISRFILHYYYYYHYHHTTTTSTTTTTTGLIKIMLTLMDYFSPADRRTPRYIIGFKWYCCSLVIVLNMTANRLRPSCKSSCTYHTCFVNKWFLQFTC